MMLMYEYYKRKLSPAAQEAYEFLLANIGKLASGEELEIPMLKGLHSSKDASDAYTALRFDRPEYYFLGHYIQLKSRLRGPVTIQQRIKYSKNHILRMNNILRRVINEIVSDVRGKPILEREKEIYRRVGKRFSYKDGMYSHDLSGLLVYKNGVCESIAGMLVVAFREAGIPAIVVHGYARGECHRWCKVWINDAEYYVDVTWDMSNCKCGFRLKYFNRTYEQMAKDHQLVEDLTLQQLKLGRE